ncbi:MAG TPA: NAD(P)-binding protein [Acidimicrobiales bacterium]|jgi:hypothetical protein|nr:NAD(P)-binding protein [Acidimicrobiales bacterium]
MRTLETDYLVVGAGATGMAFVDALLAGRHDVRIVMVDRRHRPGGHWLDAYPFVRLHQPSANYGVASRTLGEDRIDTEGINAGFYERATASEICDYFGRVLDETFIGSGRVEFLGMHDYRGSDGEGHHVVSLLTGEATVVKARKLVDATYVESSIPSRHTPAYTRDDGVRLIAPNDLVDLDEPASGFTVIGAGKTAMDTCNWLLDQGVDPDDIEWLRTRDPWLINRASMQPLDLVGANMQMQARWVEAAAEAESGRDFGRRLADAGVFLRIDETVEPEAFRGATISRAEIDALRTIERVVRLGRVLKITNSEVMLTQGTIPAEPGRIYVDCTAAGLRPTVQRPVFEDSLITLQYVTIGVVPWGAAVIGHVEAVKHDDDEKNRLCPVVSFDGTIADILRLAFAGMSGLMARAADPDISAWNDACRLNPSMGAAGKMDDPVVAEAFGSMVTNIGPALRNLTARAGTPAAAAT